MSTDAFFSLPTPQTLDFQGLQEKGLTFLPLCGFLSSSAGHVLCLNSVILQGLASQNSKVLFKRGFRVCVECSDRGFPLPPFAHFPAAPLASLLFLEQASAAVARVAAFAVSWACTAPFPGVLMTMSSSPLGSCSRHFINEVLQDHSTNTDNQILVLSSFLPVRLSLALSTFNILYVIHSYFVYCIISFASM